MQQQLAAVTKKPESHCGGKRVKKPAGRPKVVAAKKSAKAASDDDEEEESQKKMTAKPKVAQKAPRNMPVVDEELGSQKKMSVRPKVAQKTPRSSPPSPEDSDDAEEEAEEEDEEHPFEYTDDDYSEHEGEDADDQQPKEVLKPAEIDVVQNVAENVANLAFGESQDSDTCNPFRCMQDHEDPNIYVPYAPSYAKPGCRFHEQPCWVCERTFSNVNDSCNRNIIVPTVKDPMYGCAEVGNGCAKYMCSECRLPRVMSQHGRPTRGRRNHRS